MPRFRPRAAALVALALVAPLARVHPQSPAPAKAGGAARASQLPTPASILGFEPGADRKLPSWKQIVDYFTALDKASPRVQVRTLGKTVLGRPFLVVFITD